MAFSVRASLEQFALPHPSGEGQLTISVAAPAVPAPDAAVPVLTVVDGDMLFGLAAETARAVSSVAGFPAHYVVGIGYDADYAEFLKRRTADLTPPIGAEALAKLGGMGAAIGGAQGGGADAFLAFLTDTLRPAIAECYPATASGPQILYGHSLGGLFAAHALLTRPGSFDAFIVSSRRCGGTILRSSANCPPSGIASPPFPASRASSSTSARASRTCRPASPKAWA